MSCLTVIMIISLLNFSILMLWSWQQKFSPLKIRLCLTEPPYKCFSITVGFALGHHVGLVELGLQVEKYLYVHSYSISGSNQGSSQIMRYYLFGFLSKPRVEFISSAFVSKVSHYLRCNYCKYLKEMSFNSTVLHNIDLAV